MPDQVPEVWKALAAGKRIVFFEYCISFIVVTLRRASRLYFLDPGQRRWTIGLRYTGLSLLLGWWGVPWGVIHTPLAVIANSLGGRDITDEMMASARSQADRMTTPRAAGEP